MAKAETSIGFTAEEKCKYTDEQHWEGNIDVDMLAHIQTVMNHEN